MNPFAFLLFRAMLGRVNGYAFASHYFVAFDSRATNQLTVRHEVKRAGGRSPSVGDIKELILKLARKPL